MSLGEALLRELSDLRRLLERMPGEGPYAALKAPLHDRIAALTRELGAAEVDTRLGRLARVLAGLFAEQSAPREFCRAALDAIGEAMDAGKGYVVLFGTGEDEVSVLAARGASGEAVSPEERSLSRSLLAEVVAKRSTVLVSDVRDTPFSKETSIVQLNLRSVLATPLFLDGRGDGGAGGSVGGAIYLENASLAHAFDERDRALLEAIAQVLAPYIQVGRRLDRAIDQRARLEATLSGRSHFKDLLGASPAIARVLRTVERLKDSDAPVLIEGESGTGKELVARALHFTGRRAPGPLVAVNCAAIPETLMESELLGHERGAFTGAGERKKGKLEQAHQGTLFLDEVAELRYEVQAKLLRVLQEQSFERVGGAETVRVDVRLVAATNKDLRKLAAAGTFREDLFHRLYVVPIALPPLRERPEDVGLLARHFLDEFTRATGKAVVFDPEVFVALQAYRFPGNVRELRNLVNRLVALAESERVTAADLPDYVTGERAVSLDKDPFRRYLRAVPRTNDELKAARSGMEEVLERYVRRLEGRFLRALLEEASGNVSEAARRAGMNRTLFHRKLKEAEAAGED